MRNLLLERVGALFLWVMLIFSVYLLLRGHNHPGGGFIGGIIASTGFTFYAIVFGTSKVKRMIGLKPHHFLGWGLSLALLAAILPLFIQGDLLTGLWLPETFPVLGPLHLGTPLLFDTGVFFVVFGTVLTIVISVMEVLKWN